MTSAPTGGQGNDLGGQARHWGGFVASGAIAFATDAMVLLALTRAAGLSPFNARPIAIAVAMVAGWQAHRRLTFDLPTRSTLQEFLGYAAVAWTSAAVNYAVFAAILLWRPATSEFLALVVASLVAMGVAYLGMRFGAFRQGLATRLNLPPGD
jgi:putative flippase GtrA